MIANTLQSNLYGWLRRGCTNILVVKHEGNKALIVFNTNHVPLDIIINRDYFSLFENSMNVKIDISVLESDENILFCYVILPNDFDLEGNYTYDDLINIIETQKRTPSH